MQFKKKNRNNVAHNGKYISEKVMTSVTYKYFFWLFLSTEYATAVNSAISFKMIVLRTEIFVSCNDYRILIDFNCNWQFNFH